MAQQVVCCSCTGLGFNSQHSHSSPQPSVTVFLGYLMPSSGLFKHHSLDVETHAGKTPNLNNNLSRKIGRGSVCQFYRWWVSRFLWEGQNQMENLPTLNANYIKHTKPCWKQEKLFKEYSHVQGTIMVHGGNICTQRAKGKQTDTI